MARDGKQPSTDDFAQFLAAFEQQCKQYPKVTSQPQQKQPARRDPLSPMFAALKKAHLV